MRRKTILVITDGIGYKPDSRANAFESAKKPTYDSLFKSTPYSLIKTYGLSVGLPDNQMGNSEVGHMTIGSGRVLYQDLVKISMAIEDGSIEKNEALNQILKDRDRVHIVGLLSDGGVHSHIKHFIGVANIAKSRGVKVYLHLITDGRDVSPTSAKEYIEQIEKICSDRVKIASISGRFYTMDRDSRWERVQRGYRAIVEATPTTTLEPKSYIDENYSREIFDEFIEPTAFESYDGAKEGDGFIFINFRSDRAREIVTAIGDSQFSEFKRERGVFDLVTMTEYNREFNYPTLFKKEPPKNTLAQTISRAGLTQLHTAETEKYAHVTFFLNGGIDEPFEAEERVLIPSPKVKTYDEKPQMSAKEVADVVLEAMDSGRDFIVVNFANGDMVGHTGVFEAGVKAVEAVDRELGRVLDKAKERDYSVVLTSDHGNCEEMIDKCGNTLTNHTIGDVWCFVIDPDIECIKRGGLNNIAPTVLKLLGVEIPKEMDEPLIKI